MLRNLLPIGIMALGSIPTSADATLLYVSSYIGTVTTLNLTLPQSPTIPCHRHARHQKRAEATLDVVSSTDECAPNPSWLTLDHDNGVVYCSDEGLESPIGHIAAFQTEEDGTLTLLDVVETVDGPVSAVMYGDGGSGLAVAQYLGSALTTINITDPASLSLIQKEDFTIEEPGPVPWRQDESHPHEALLDPTHQFILVPDLGGDQIRLFKYNASTLAITPADPPVLTSTSGSGPRHADFYIAETATYMYVVGELDNTITLYEVNYDDEDVGLGFTEIAVIGSHGEGVEVPEGVTSAEVHISPDNKFLLLSTRYDATFSIPSFTEPDVEIPSDSIVSFAIDQDTGVLSLAQHVPCGGQTPRQFSMNKAGDLLVVGAQDDGRVVIIERDPATGDIGGIIASAEVEGGLTCAIFNE